jgi:hypothetical protein
MTDPTGDESRATDAALADEPIPGDTGGSRWASDASPTEGSTGGREWMAQLQKMIDDVATQAAPVARQIAAKAAELAAVAAEKAGPAMHRAADVTTDVGQKVAERAQKLATDLRHDADAAGASTDGQSKSSSD